MLFKNKHTATNRYKNKLRNADYVSKSKCSDNPHSIAKTTRKRTSKHQTLIMTVPNISQRKPGHK